MQTEKRDRIEAELFHSTQLGFESDEALAEAAGLIAEAEAAFVRLAHPGF